MNYVYRLDGQTAFTQDCAAGPWDPGLQHGGAPAALIAWLIEQVPAREPMQIVRLTLDLLRPVPIAPLAIESSVEREGRKIQVCAVTLKHAGVPVVRASALKVRCAELPLPAPSGIEPVLLPGAAAGREMHELLRRPGSFVSGLSLRVVQGGFFEPGPAAIWFRAQRPIIEGQPLTALMRAAIAADFCNGVSSVLDLRQWTFINADLTLHLARMPLGEWILLDAQTWLGPHGSGLACARLGDEHGYFGRAVQSLVIERRAPRAKPD